MKLKFAFLDNDISFNNSYVNVLEVENKKYFYRIIQNLFSINEDISEEVTIFDDSYKEINLNNKINVIVDYFNIDYNNRKYTTEINKMVSNLVNEDTRKSIYNNYKKIYSLLNNVLNDIDIPLSISDNPDFDSILKLVKISINSKNDILDNLLLLIDIEKVLKINKILVFVNLKQYLTHDELNELYKYSIYNNVTILLIDSQAYGVSNKYEKKLIIDNNLDEIVL